jgi:ribosomal protein L23
MTASYKNNRYTLLDLRIKTNYAFKKFKNKMSIEKQITYYYSVRQSKINTLFQRHKVFDYFRL